MPSFGARSIENLENVDPRLVAIAHEVIEFYDFAVTTGWRGEEAQNRAFAERKSKKRWPHGRHNAVPSMALDVEPYPIDYDDEKRYSFLAGLFTAIGHTRGVRLRWGGDWDSDGLTKDQKFHDLAHVEIVD